jgi:hypothetical protein
MPTLDWKHYTLAALILAALAAWGSRERSYKKELIQQSTARDLAEERVKTVTTEKETLQKQLTRATEANRKRREERRPDGTIIITEDEVTRITENATETATRSAKVELEEARAKISELEVKIKVKESETIKSAPRWAAGYDFDAFAPVDVQHRGAVGANFGPLTFLVSLAPTGAARPLATGAGLDAAFAATRPHLGVLLRF